MSDPREGRRSGMKEMQERDVAEPFVFEETAQGKAIWKREHAALFAGFSRGTHAYFATGHNIHREDPKAVAEAIRSVSAASQGNAN